MKKQAKIIIGIVVLLAIGIAVASIFFSRPKGEDSSGTIGKADKYRKDQMAARDILLRDDILQDTAALRKTLKQLVEFTLYSFEVKKVIDSSWIAPLKQNCVSPDCNRFITPLQEYSDFIGNNLPMMRSTNEMLAKCYHNSTRELPMDVGFQLLNFVTFVDQFLDRDTVFDKAITEIDKFIKADKSIDKKHKVQVATLKKIRDKMVIDNLLFAYNTGDKDKLNYSSAIVLYNVDDIKSLILSNPLSVIEIAAVENVVGNINTMGVFMSAPGTVGSSPLIPCAEISAAFTAQQANSVSAVASSIVSSAVVSSIVHNSSIIMNHPDLGNAPLSSLISVASFPTVSNSIVLGVLNPSDLNSTIFNSQSDVFQNITNRQ